MRLPLARQFFRPRFARTALNLGAVALLTLGSLSAADPIAPLRVGMDLSYPPFESIGPDGQAMGISVDLARALAAELGRPLQLENIPFTGLIPSLKSAKIDLIISSMTATPERAKAVAFSEPYLTTGLAALVPRDGSGSELASLDQPGKTIVVRQGTTGEVFARQNIKNARVLTLEKENACVLEVVQGKAAAFIYDQMSVFQNARRNPETTRALLTPLQAESWAVALRLGDEELRSSVNAFLQKFRSSGGFDRLAAKYLAEEKAAFAAQGIPFFF
ncbi:MAG: transporter substrate-binding domain-containing protein [Chthoniobacterales bacterium]|nr:transporter substrate-binding domain-containing protein [Chthoniobacterales bacterium]